MAKTISIETTIRIYDDDYGYFIEVRRDAETDGIIIRYSDGEKDNSADSAVSIPQNMCQSVAEAIATLPPMKEVSKDG